MLSAAVLVPAMIDTNRLLHQRDHMREQAAAMTKLAGNYKAFHVALRENDPVVLERLAYAQLRRKLEGAEPLRIESNPASPVTADGWMRSASIVNANTAVDTSQLVEPPPIIASVESMIGDPATIADMNFPIYQPPQNRLVRLTTGSLRLGFMIAAAGLVLAGLMWTSKLPNDVDDAPADDDEWLIAELDEDDNSDE